MRRTLVLLAFLAVLAPLSALEAKDGLMKVALYENSGRFNVYFLQDVAKDIYVPFLFERDPRTSSLNLFVDDRMYRLGESSEFRTSARKTDDGAEFVFKSSACQVTQSFSFTKSQGAALTDGVQMRITIENISERDMSVGLRIIMDSYLGEKSGTHFSTDSRPKLTNETRLSSSSKEQWIASVNPDSSVGMKLFLQSGTRPDSVIVANWSRINSSPWNFAFDASRNFTLQPYSVNDSAIAVDYDAATIPRSKARLVEINLYSLSADAPQGIAAQKTAAVLDSVPIASNTQVTSVQADLLAIRDIIDQINKKISSGQDLTPEEKKAISDTIERLKSRKNSY
jgi:hypothetical protein